MRFALVVVLAVVLAGCSDAAPATSDDSTSGPTPKNVDVSKDLGAISGVVVDAAVVPIAGAWIQVKGDETNVTSDDDGSFVIEDVTPGTYFLDVGAVGYATVQTSVDVKAGEVSKPRLQLTAVQTVEPVHYTMKHDGFIEFSGGITGPLINIFLDDLDDGNPLCKCSLNFNTDGEDLRTLVVEAIWESNIEQPAGESDMYLEVFPAELDDGTDDIQGGYLTSPILRHYPIELWGEDENNVEWQTRLTGGGFSVYYQQDYELFVTVFNNVPAPEGWSFIDGDR